MWTSAPKSCAEFVKAYRLRSLIHVRTPTQRAEPCVRRGAGAARTWQRVEAVVRDFQLEAVLVWAATVKQTSEYTRSGLMVVWTAADSM
jgi:hypothetical protein